MDEKILNTYLRDMKFVVLADPDSGNPMEIFFDFHLPSMHEEIFNAAKLEYEQKGMKVSVHGGGRITKRNNNIVFHGRSQKYGRFENEDVLKLAPSHPLFCNSDFIFISKSGRDDVDEIIKEFMSF
jgi:hypothetical protein